MYSCGLRDKSKKPVIQDLSLRVARGQLVMVVGQVGVLHARACMQGLRAGHHGGHARKTSECGTVAEAALAALCAQIGSGKSSLLLALLGEMYRIGGAVRTEGSIAYTSQVSLGALIIFSGHISLPQQSTFVTKRILWLLDSLLSAAT